MSDTEPIAPLALIITFLILSVVGIFGNLTIVLVTFINKTLHTRCCILIGIMAFFNFVVCIYLAQLRIMMLYEMYNISNSTCFYLSAYGIFAMNMQSILGLFIGLDRLYNVSSPVRYAKVSLFSYIIVFLICIIVSLFVTISRFVFLYTETSIVVCIPVTALYQTSLRIWLGFNFVISILVVIIYGWTHTKCTSLKSNNMHLKTIEAVNRILNSLIVVVAFYVCTWFTAMASLFVSEFMHLEGEILFIIRKSSGWLVICNSSLHVFIYFWRTPDYRKAIIQLYKLPFNSGSNSKVQVSVAPKNHVLVI